MATRATCRWASQPAKRPSPAVVVLNRSLSVTAPPRGPGSRTHAATLSRCTSSPATRSYSNSMAPPLSRVVAATRRGGPGNQPNLGFVLAATIPGPAGPAPDLLRAQAAPVSRRRPRPADRRQHFIPPGWPAGSCRLVPFGGARREVADGDAQARLGGQGRQFGLPCPVAVAVGAASIRGDQQPGGLRVVVVASRLPPAADGGDRERGGVVVGADVDPAGVAGEVVDAIGNGLLGLRVGE